MKMSRSGAIRNHGTQPIFGESLSNVTWNEFSLGINLTIREVPDFKQEGSTYDYQVFIEFAELARCLAVIQDASSNSCKLPNELYQIAGTLVGLADIGLNTES